MKKKLIAVLMILLLGVCMFACGSDDAQDPTESDVQIETGEAGDAIDDGEDTPEYIFPNSIEPEYEDEGDSFDLGAKAKKSFLMSSTLEKMNYSKLSASGDSMQSTLEAALAKAGMGNFVIAFNEYEEYDDDYMDKQAYVAAIEDDDMDKAIIEMGAYHDSYTDSYYQYNGYTSMTLTSQAASVKTILADISSAYGVELSESKVKKALKTAWKEAERIEDYYGVYQRIEFEGDGYSDSIIVRVDVGYDEDDNMGAYIYVERERQYS